MKSCRPERARTWSQVTAQRASHLRGAQKAKALEDANDYCKQQNKEVETITDRETDSGFGKIASAEIEFRCVAPGK
jgi:hypothetical protein